MKDLKPSPHGCQIVAHIQSLIDAERHKGGQRTRSSTARSAYNLRRHLLVTRTAAVGTVNRNVGQELHVEVHRPRPVAGRTAETARVVGEVARLVTTCLCRLRARVDLAELVVHVCVCGDS